MSDEIIIYRCTECGKTSLSYGGIHAHVQKHTGFGPWNLIPDPRKIANAPALDEYTEELVAEIAERNQPPVRRVDT